MITLAVFTDGRRDCIAQAIPSALENLRGPISQFIIFDDSADPAYQDYLLDQFPGFDLVCGPMRLGFGGNIGRAWNHLLIETSNPYVFHLEDDFTFNRTIHLEQMIDVLDSHPYLMQLALRRQPWNNLEREAGGIVEQFPNAYEDCFDSHFEWLEHRLFFTTNPSLYRLSLCSETWPDIPQSEGMFTHELLGRGIPTIAPSDIRFGFWGPRSSGEMVTHIGAERMGKGY